MPFEVGRDCFPFSRGGTATRTIGNAVADHATLALPVDVGPSSSRVRSTMLALRVRGAVLEEVRWLS